MATTGGDEIMNHAAHSNVEPDLVSRAWLLKGLGHTPGVLVAVGGMVAFVDDGGTVFEAPRAQIELTWPRLQMSGGAVFRVGGERHRIAFVRPNGAVDTSRSTLANLGYALAGSGTIFEVGRLAGDVSAGRATGKRWRQYLS